MAIDAAGRKEQPGLHAELRASTLHRGAEAFPRENGRIVTSTPFQRCLEINVHAMTRCRPHFHRVPTHLLICAKYRICISDYAQHTHPKLACGLRVAQSATHGINAQRLTFNSGPTTHEAPKTPTFIMIALVRRRTSPDCSEQSEHRSYLDIAITP